MKRFLSLLAVLLVCASAAHAGVLRLRGGAYVATINFGSRTVIGWGDYATVLAPGATLTGTGNADFSVNSGSALVPAGTKGSGTAIFTRSSYLLSSSGLNFSIGLLTGDQSIALEPVYSISTQVRNMFFGPCGLSTCTAKPTLGSTLWLRNGAWNTSNALGDTGFKPVSQYTGSGRITARSENPDVSLDVNGNPRLQHGSKLGMVYWDPDLNEASPVDFRDIWFYNDSAAPTTDRLFGFAGGSGANFYNSRVEYGPDVVNPTAQYGLVLVGATTVDHMHFVNIGTALLESGGNLTVSNTIFEGIRADAMQFSGDNILIDHVFGFGWLGLAADHPDFIQWTGGSFNNTGITYRYDIAVQDLGGGLDSCLRIGDIVPPWIITNVSLHNNICYHGSSHGAGVPDSDHPTMSFNTILTDPFSKPDGSHVNSVARVELGINGAVVDHNVINQIDTSTQAGVITGSANISMATNSNYDASTHTSAQLCATYQLAMPNLVCNQSDAKWKTRAGVLFMFTPGDTAVASGGFKQLDGTFSGALFPACLTQVNGAWNDGVVYACDAAWLISHPAAT